MRRKQGSSKQTAVIYARVSSKEQEEEGFSIPAQLRVLREYAARHELIVECEFVEAETAKKTGRNAFDAMLKFLRDRSGAAILVEKTDRLYRNFADFVKVDELGAELHFVKEGQVVRPDSHSSEKLMHSIKVCLAKNYIDNLSEEIRKGMREKAMQGMYPSHSPLGYLNSGREGKKTIVPDPERAPIIRRLFEEFAQGRSSLKELAAAADQWGLRTKKGHKLVKSQIHRTLKNEVYIGRVPWAGMVFEGVHEPIIDAATFYRVQEILEGRRNSRRGYGTVPISYRGLVTCALCGCLYAGEIKKGRYIYYHCCGRQTGCEAPYVKEQLLTELFAEQLDLIRIPSGILSQLEAALSEAQAVHEADGQALRARLDVAIEKNKKALASLYEDKIAGEVSIDTYRSLRERFEGELASAQAQLQGLGLSPVSKPIDVVRALELVASAGDRFKQGDPEQRRQIVENLYSNSKFDGQTLAPIPRIEHDDMLKAVQITNQELADQGAGDGEIGDWWRQGDSNP